MLLLVSYLAVDSRRLLLPLTWYVFACQTVTGFRTKMNAFRPVELVV